MKRLDGAEWELDYGGAVSDTRYLVSLPMPMLRDVRLLAEARGISVAEFFRRAVVRDVAAEIAARPEVAASFKGKQRA